MNTPNPFPPTPAAGHRHRPALALLFAVCIALALAVGGIYLAASRSVPWGQRVELEVWASLVAPLPAEDAMVLLAADATPAGDSGQGWLARLGALISWFSRQTCQLLVTVRTDQAAIVLDERQVSTTGIPCQVQPGSGMPPVTVLSLGERGAVSLSVGSLPACQLVAGAGLDLALVPAPGGGWTVSGGDWCEAVTARLSAGQPVGRLTVVNHGLRPASQSKE